MLVAAERPETTGTGSGRAWQAASSQPPVLEIGAPAPDFNLPGIDGKTYSLASFKDSKVLVVLFTAVHCPTAEVYEHRIKQLVADYRNRGVGLVVIQPNNAEAVRLDEMGYTDLGDSIDDMKIRADHRKFNFAFLYDGEKQDVSRLYGPTATPHAFVFDQERKLRYQGRIDSNPREALAKVPDARNALDAVLAGNAVPVEKTPAVGNDPERRSRTATGDPLPYPPRPARGSAHARPCRAVAVRHRTGRVLSAGAACNPCRFRLRVAEYVARFSGTRTQDLKVLRYAHLLLGTVLGACYLADAALVAQDLQVLRTFPVAAARIIRRSRMRRDSGPHPTCPAERLD